MAGSSLPSCNVSTILFSNQRIHMLSTCLPESRKSQKHSHVTENDQWICKPDAHCVPSGFEFENFPISVLFKPTFKKGLTNKTLADFRPVWIYPRLPFHPLATTKETGDYFFSISFNTKPCDTDQASGIIQVTKYCRDRSWQFVVQHDSSLNNGWCLNVLIRPDQSGSIQMKSVAKGFQAVLVNHAHISKGVFTVHKRACQLEESRVLDQSFCQDPCIETRRPHDVTPATPVASGSNSAIQNTGDE